VVPGVQNIKLYICADHSGRHVKLILSLHWSEPWPIFCPPFGGKMVPIVFS
jgi:hypothetical protein